MDLTLGVVVSVAIGISLIVVFEEALGSVIRRAARGAGVSATVMRDVAYSLRLIAALVILYWIISLAGLSSEFTALTLSGIGAFAVSLALQNTLSNIISGILLFADGAVHLDDVVGYGSIKGKIVRVALRNTWIKTESGEIAVVGNSTLAAGPFVNYTATARLSKKYAIE